MSDTHDEVPWLHIYGQEGHHDPVLLVGTRRGLLTLINACLAALHEPPLGTTQQPAPHVYVNDGEGYEVQVTLVPSTEVMDTYAVPYSGRWAHDAEASLCDTWPRKAGWQPPPGETL